jgi:hypothetical protein
MCHSRYEKKYLQVIIACIQTQNNHEILFNISFNNHLQLNLISDIRESRNNYDGINYVEPWENIVYGNI